MIVFAIAFDELRLKVVAGLGKDMPQVLHGEVGEPIAPYLVINTQWTCKAITQCLPVRYSFESSIVQW